MKYLIFAVGFVWSLIGTAASAQERVVIDSTTVVSAHLAAPLPEARIVIRDGRIEAVGAMADIPVPDGAAIIDGRSKWIISGIVEFHSHAILAAELRRALALGVTTAHTVARPESPSQRIELSHEPATPSPRLLLLNAYVGEFMERMGSQGVRKPRSVEEARRDVVAMRDAGASAVKIWQDDGSLWFDEERRFPPVPADVFHALVEAARRADMRTAVHAWRLPFFQDALDAGVDALMHPVADSLVSLPLWQQMVEQDLAWTTTMAVLLMYGDPGQYARRILSDPRLTATLSEAMREQLESDATATGFASHAFMPALAANIGRYMTTVRQNTLNALGNGVSVVVGSDAPPGIGTHLEIELLAETGLPPLQILAAATLNGARALDLDDRLGTIEAGKLADLVILNADPLEDVRNWRDVFAVLKGGHAFDPTGLVEGTERSHGQ